MSDLTRQIQQWDWQAIAASLDADGFVPIPRLLDDPTCEALIESFGEEQSFRKRVVMEKHGYGRGVYQYFSYPLPKLVAQLRQDFFGPLAKIANRWQERLGLEPVFPRELDTYLEQCHGAGQIKPTPLILRYGPGDFNRLHRDLYGEMMFPLQVVFLLNEPTVDFEGGELVLVEQKPRSQSKANVVPLAKGQGVIFAVNQFPGLGVRGYRRLKLSHGVSRIRAGLRHTLGIIFHDAG